VQLVKEMTQQVRIDQVECVWEPGMILAARIREALGLPGMTVEETVPFRDKEDMKRVLDEAGIRTPRHARANSVEEIQKAAEEIGFPLIIKPIAGAGSADTHRVNSKEELEKILPLVSHVPSMSVEEFIDGEEFTYDTICAGGEIVYENVCWYRPRPLTARQVEWISPQTVALRDLGEERLQPGIKMGHDVIKALGYQAGYTHMEWFLTEKGEAVFGEIGARAPGARTVDLMNYVSDADLYTGWAEAVIHGRLTQDTSRKYNAVSIFKRAQGQGHIQSIQGLENLMAAYGPHVMSLNLLPVGAHRRNWKQTLLSDGWVFLRHPDLPFALEMANRFGTDLSMYAG
ncbi:MAG: ATP-grasp domain-containing protein, partial [Candidatus Eisenbacteria bacterium]|nr:ATP-grasp domain-containing protein [Candidatus Eisenbacteria bacterium]